MVNRFNFCIHQLVALVALDNPPDHWHWQSTICSAPLQFYSPLSSVFKCIQVRRERSRSRKADGRWTVVLRRALTCKSPSSVEDARTKRHRAASCCLHHHRVGVSPKRRAHLRYIGARLRKRAAKAGRASYGSYDSLIRTSFAERFQLQLTFRVEPPRRAWRHSNRR